ncbi:MAG: site-specific integrase [candidate division WOR-3 bacterium]|nr:site-specific integrase [candidate division WOR-3 bacterium]
MAIRFVRRGVYDIDLNFPDGRFRKRFNLPLKEVRKIYNELEKIKYYKEIGLPYRNKITVKELFYSFERIKQRQLRESSWDTYEHRIDFWKGKHSGQIFIPLDRLKIEKIMSDELSHLANKTLNSYINLLRQLYDYAISINACEKNTAKDIPRLPGKPRRKPRFLSKDEFKKLLEHSPDFYKDLWTLMVYTGIRRNEARFLEWSDIDFENDVIRIFNKQDFTTKNKEGRIIPTNKEVKKLLKKRKKKNGLIFPSPSNKPYHPNVWRKKIKHYAKKAGIENVTLHTLRHTFASWLVMEKVDITTISKLMGHSDIKTTMIYAHLAPDYMRKAVNKLPKLGM